MVADEKAHLTAATAGLAEADVALQVMARGNVFQIAQDFRLLRLVSNSPKKKRAP
jgi:hypothetical protein